MAGLTVVTAALAGPATAQPAGEEVTPGAGAVTASTSDANVPANAVDGDLGTRWSGEGDGAWLQLDLGTAETVSHVKLAAHQGTSRQNVFELQVWDGAAWETVYEGRTSGSSAALETFAFDPVETSRIRYLGHGYEGDGEGDWNSLTEVEVWTGDSGDDPGPGPGRTVEVEDSDQLQSAFDAARAGDRIVLADGAYTIGEMSGRNGTADQPITVVAANRGQAEIDDGQLEVENSSYVTFEGLTWTNSDTLKITSSNNVRLTRNHFRLTEESSLKWVLIGGANSHHNRIDHNLFEEKHELGNFITVDGSETQQSQYDRIDHNHFRAIGPRAENEMEAIRVGWSEISESSGHTVVEYNLFEECDGDPEIVSVKSNDNTVRYNTFRASQGTVTQRHGNGGAFYGNFFLGEGKAGTGGIRVYGQDHTIYNNYFEGLTGTGYDAALQLDGGDVDTSGALSDHWRVYRATVVNNTFVNNVSNIEIGANYDLAPVDSTIADNVVTGSRGELFSELMSPVNLTYAGNIAWPTGSATIGVSEPSSAIMAIDPLLALDGLVHRIGADSPAVDAGTGGHPFVTDDMDGHARTGTADVGADEYTSAPATRGPLGAADVGPGAA
ncbi:chondroitinase-B domain-containing protein [Streptomyces sp. SBT349]|uniref:chondroitinase-B domain-containing protein n=1 Tax=Streptomyces sp. SBT349 TaxID=1580539 RepID=UPI001F42409F|nr:chondroitinase-B domain-containing protein [Streptomyces sp. SBT349]